MSFYDFLDLVMSDNIYPLAIVVFFLFVVVVIDLMVHK